MKIYVALVLLLFTNASHGQSQKPLEAKWAIKSVNVALRPEKRGRVVATFFKTGDAHEIKVEDDIPFDELERYFVANDKLILSGHSGNVDSVVIIDLLRQAISDWFYCYRPQQIWDSWIAYVEWYPNHTPARVTDVILVYDTAKSPVENRQGKLRQIPIEATNRTRVGFPIYPESNAAQNSYLNTVENQADVRLALGSSNFLAMANKKLIVAVGEEPEGDATSLKTYLAIVDLSGGLSHAKVSQLRIPTDQLKKGNETAYVQVMHMEAVSANTIRLEIPESEYGVSSILVNIPKS